MFNQPNMNMMHPANGNMQMPNINSMEANVLQQFRQHLNNLNDMNFMQQLYEMDKRM